MVMLQAAWTEQRQAHAGELASGVAWGRTGTMLSLQTAHEPASTSEH